MMIVNIDISIFVLQKRMEHNYLYHLVAYLMVPFNGSLYLFLLGRFATFLCITFNSTELNAVELAFPRIDEQRVVRERLDSLENTKFRTHVHLEKLRSLKTALMQDLLTGEKRVTLLLDSTVTN